MSDLKNKFFARALGKAGQMKGNKRRIVVLVGQLLTKMNTLDTKTLSRHHVWDKLSVLGRLTKSYATGHYRTIPWKSMMIILGAIIYFINPIDLVADIIPLAGFTDDFAVLLWVYKSIGKDVEDFLKWEKGILPTAMA